MFPPPARWGAIKILSAQSYKGGTRLAVVCGERAHQSIAAAWQDAAAVGTLLSSAPGRLLPAVQNLQTAEAALKQRLAAMQNALSGSTGPSRRARPACCAAL